MATETHSELSSNRLMGLFVVIVLVLGVVTVAVTVWTQHKATETQKVVDHRLDQGRLEICQAVNADRRASNKNAATLVGFLRAAQRAREKSASAHAKGSVERREDERAARIYNRLANSYSQLALLNCRSAFDTGG